VASIWWILATPILIPHFIMPVESLISQEVIQYKTHIAWGTWSYNGWYLCRGSRVYLWGWAIRFIFGSIAQCRIASCSWRYLNWWYLQCSSWGCLPCHWSVYLWRMLCVWRMLCDYLGEETNIVNDWWKEFRMVCESLVSVLISVCEVLIEERIAEFWYQP